MAQKYSRGFVDWLNSEGSVQKMFADAKIRVFSGNAPADADQAESGTLLCQLTLGASTSYAKAVAKQAYISITGTPSSGNIVRARINGTTYTTTLATATAVSKRTAARAVAEVVDLALPIIAAAAASTATDGGVVLKSSVRGQAFTCALGTCTITATITTSTVSNSRGTFLQLGPTASGIVSKISTETWSGVNVATGVAGYFRIVQPGDDGTLSYTQPRVQGSIGTTGADWNMDSVQFTIGATTTVNTGSIQLPMSE
jgi:hypothetical protein